jgi:excisionase family DNA binding protein
MKVQEVAYRFNVSVETVRRWIRGHEIDAVHIGRAWDISEDAITRFKDRRRNSCLGHLHILKGTFPFVVKGDSFYIDSEYCIPEIEDGLLRMQFCPVCGKILNNVGI